MDLDKKIFPTAEIMRVIDKLKKAEALSLIRPLAENNQYLMCSYAGTGVISPKWSVKIYAYSKNKKGHSMICTDTEVLNCFMADNFDFKPPALKLLKIDDAGWGFPLCGVMVGVTDEAVIHTDVVPVEFFQGENFAAKKYLKEYTERGLRLIGEKFGATPATHRVEICTGFVNKMLRDELRKLGFHVRVIEVKGMLQDGLEERFRQYVHTELATDIYYDPKEIARTDLPRKFNAVLEFGKKHFPLKLKTGWKSIGESPVS
ncbi:MAG: hypothetical protein A2008_09645 [Candidatus Wallbacteria bacterium GWC2_49_35]|uniref:Uncharacterized protein n=1 Tax=Candidatus Wallbacteria bacterium GWC2_49_35 TaxID=1817813 RepID=A0A1F7WVE2_9BACT|nr:MAG: hypothetical protein A2008_09645 [Candidatus Wallbacteria bacterium GWC2_49_35]HBC73563.1 hypothetical protein [Candidatus Wallbacteria bacterium]